tara:strand:+ start:1295 stop:1465 length:171 start_codon:yes stop_codon:yes gene_type:complete
MTANKILGWLTQQERSKNWFAKKLGISPQLLKYWIDNNVTINNKYQKKIQNIIDTY